jgi:hypothetical protein
MTETETPNEDKQQTSTSNTDWDNRILCSDGNCIGVIGPDGHCKECGKKYEGTLPETAASGKESPSEREEASGAGADIDDQPQSSAAGADVDAQPQSSAAVTSGDETESDDWSARKLCSDGNCIGVIGRDGRCRECGKPSE